MTLVAVSRAPFEKLAAYRERLGWWFTWLSSFRSDFNRDFHVSFTAEERDTAQAFYNFRLGRFPASEAPGLSVFFKERDERVFHTYSCYARGLDGLMGTYQFLDLVPRGRDEAGLPHTMSWVRHHATALDEAGWRRMSSPDAPRPRCRFSWKAPATDAPFR